MRFKQSTPYTNTVTSERTVHRLKKCSTYGTTWGLGNSVTRTRKQAQQEIESAHSEQA